MKRKLLAKLHMVLVDRLRTIQMKLAMTVGHSIRSIPRTRVTNNLADAACKPCRAAVAGCAVVKKRPSGARILPGFQRVYSGPGRPWGGSIFHGLELGHRSQPFLFSRSHLFLGEI